MPRIIALLAILAVVLGARFSQAARLEREHVEQLQSELRERG